MEENRGDPPQNPDNMDMVKPCEICGDIGYEDALRVCSQCKITQHVYCMRVMYEGDPEEWVCEECNVRNQTSFSKPASSARAEAEINCSAARSTQTETQISCSAAPIAQAEDVKARSSIRKPPQNTKVQYIPLEEAMKLKSGLSKNTSRSPSKMVSVPKREPIQSKAGQGFSVKSNPSMGPPGFEKKLHGRSMPNSLADQRLSNFVEKRKPAVHNQHAWKELPLKIGSSGTNAWKEVPLKIGSSGTNAQTSNAVVDKNTVIPEIGSIRHLGRETLTAKPSPLGELPKRNTESYDQDFGHTSLQLVHCLPATNSEKGPVEHLCTPTKPLNVGEFRTSDSGPVQHLRSPTTPLINGELRTPDTNRVGADSAHTSLPDSNVGSGVDVHTDTQPRKIDPERRELSEVAMGLDKRLPNHPAESPTWKGYFKVTGGVVPCEFSDAIQAYPPCKVSRKVYELSKELPKVLQFELLPRLSLWLDIFEDYVPCELDIGLYFLPSKRDEQMYTSLVQYLDQREVFLRSYIDGFELLIFSSKHLQETSQKIAQKYFLWGLLRASDSGVYPTHLSDQLEQPEAEDMDIDMIGGHLVGKIDVCVPKPTIEARMNSLVKNELVEFDKELQRSFDRFSEMMMRAGTRDCVKMEE